jgi:hypothetical protein
MIIIQKYIPVPDAGGNTDLLKMSTTETARIKKN